MNRLFQKINFKIFSDLLPAILVVSGLILFRFGIDPFGNHNIDCKVDGFGAMGLKSIYVRKAV